MRAWPVVLLAVVGCRKFTGDDTVDSEPVDSVDGADSADTGPIDVNVAPRIDGLLVQPLPLARGGTATVTATASDADDDALTFTFAVTGAFTVTPGTGGNATLTGPDTPEATGELTITVDDGRGGTATSTIPVATDRNVAPTIASLVAAPVPVGVGGEVTLSVVAADADNDALTYTWTAPTGWGMQAGTDTATLIAPSTYGATGLAEVVVSDGASGEARAQVTVSTRTNANPTIASVTADPPLVAHGGSIALEVAASDPDGDTLTVAWTAPQAWILSATSGTSVSVTAPDLPGASGTIGVTVTDAAGATASGSVVVGTLANHAPALASVVASPVPVALGGTVTVSALASDADQDPLTYAWTAPTGWTLSGSGATVTLTAPSTYSNVGLVRVTVSDPWGGSEPGQVEVRTRGNSAPLISAVSATPPAVRKGGTIALVASATDPEGDAITFTWAAPSGWSLQSASGASTSLTAPLAYDQTGTVTLTARDAGGAQSTATVGVATLPNQAPVVSSVVASPSTLARGGTATLSASAVDPDGDPLTYGWTAPTGWSVTGTGPTVTLTAPAVSAATAIVDLVVSDAFGGHTAAQVAVSTEANRAPVISGLVADATSLPGGASTTVRATASDPDNDPLTYTWTVSDPSWTIAGTGAAATLTAPTAGTSTGTTVRVQVSDGTATAERTVDVTRAFAASCQALLGTDADQGTGIYTVSPTGSAADAHPVLCDMTTDGGGWTLVYKHSSDVQVDLLAGMTSGPLNADDVSLLDRGQDVADYASPLLSRWSTFGEARVEIADGGAAAAYITLSTWNTTPANFFGVGKVVDSSWTDLVTGAYNHFSTPGDAGIHRYWFVNRSYNGCPEDYGWMVVSGSPVTCSWAHPWKVQYATGTTIGHWGTGTDADADAMLVWVREGFEGKTQAKAGATCKQLVDDGIAETDGRYFVDPDGQGGSDPFQTYCDVTGGGWTLAYKKSTGAAGAPATDWRSGDRFVTDFAAMDRGKEPVDYANPAATTGWAAFSEARVEVLVGGAPAHVMRFSTTGATNADWMTPSRLQASTWTDLATGSFNYFGVDGDTGNTRHFFINQNYGGCAADVGWLVAKGTSTVCPWDTPNAVRYATGTTGTNWTMGAVGTADALAVFLR